MSQAIITKLAEILKQLGGTGSTTNAAAVSINKINRVFAFSTNTPLGANEVYTSPTIDAINYKSHNNSIISDQAGSSVRQHSDDGVVWISELATAVTANTLSLAGSAILRRYIRIVYTNGATPQTSFSLSFYLSPVT